IVGSPLQVAVGYRGLARCCLGLPGWNEIGSHSSAAEPLDQTFRAVVLLYKYGVGVPNGWTLPDAEAMSETAELLEFAKRAGDNFTLFIARFARGLILLAGGFDRRVGLDLLGEAREAALQERFQMVTVVIIDIERAKEKMRNGEID